MPNRRVLHMDMDAFFAAVEQHEHPEYRGKPLIVGGRSDRSVVATCSYEARAYGIHSAMSSVVARRLCPHAIFVSGNMRHYSAVSHAIFDPIEAAYPKMQRVSIDEAYIDVTGMGDAEAIARSLQEDVYHRTGLTVSIGISYNKFLAKLASDWKKPAGLFFIGPDEVEALLKPLPILRIHGLGKRSAERLNRIGIMTIGDLMQYPEDTVYSILGEAWGREIVQRIHGIDHRPVQNDGERKSYGRETTLSEDTEDRNVLLSVLKDFLGRIAERFQGEGILTKTLTIKIKYADFETVTRSYSFGGYINDYDRLEAHLVYAFEQIVLDKPVRLIGLSFSNLESEAHRQYDFLDAIATE